MGHIDLDGDCTSIQKKATWFKKNKKQITARFDSQDGKLEDITGKIPL